MMKSFKICPLIDYRLDLKFYIKKKVFLFWFNECEVVQGVGMSWKRSLTFDTLDEAKQYLEDNYGKSANIVNNYL